MDTTTSTPGTSAATNHLSGEAFNAIELDPQTMRPFNPMINAGAIAVSSLIKKSSRDQASRPT